MSEEPSNPGRVTEPMPSPKEETLSKLEKAVVEAAEKWWHGRRIIYNTEQCLQDDIDRAKIYCDEPLFQLVGAVARLIKARREAQK